MKISRWPIIRHVRYLWLRHKVYQQATFYGRIGIGLGNPNPKDLDHLEEIWRGNA